ncbi:hypothetical protein [Neisseria wadsworthii]|uniref:Uncharacterized protein n=1 Tax=Neisseria wadsworthii 9715 TaxID=1030841 RepID=G4CTC5_9NEIS|nr:hypothetical protein [Neisseria wadsworthii]EGZ44289.1 hypothetical protein HMPREF9370_2335 [Neisseria wadsworthii 9715]
MNVLELQEFEIVSGGRRFIDPPPFVDEGVWWDGSRISELFKFI